MAGWSQNPTAFIKVVEEDLVDKRKEITSDVLQAVISGSPVDTGTYKGNHRVSLDGEDLGYDLEEQDKTGEETLRKGLAVVGQIDTPFGDSIVQNNLPYAKALEDGHSLRAADGIYGPSFAAVKEKYGK